MAEAEFKSENQLNGGVADPDMLDEDFGLKPFGNLVKDEEGYIIDEFFGRTKVMTSAPDQNQSFSFFKKETLNDVAQEEDERILADIRYPRQNYNKSFTQNGSVVLQAQFPTSNGSSAEEESANAEPLKLGTGFLIPDKKFEGKDTIDVFSSPNGGITGKLRRTRCILTAAHCVMNSKGEMAENLAIYVINPEKYENARVKEETDKKAGNTGERFDRMNLTVRKDWKIMRSAGKYIQRKYMGRLKIYVLPDYVDNLRPLGSDIALIVLPTAVEAVFSDIDAVIGPDTTPEDVKYTCVDGFPGEDAKSYLLYKSGGFKEKGDRGTQHIIFSKSSIQLGKPIGGIQYNCQTTAGQSGGCVKLDLGKGKYQVGAIHNCGVQVSVDGVKLGTGENWGSLITSYVLDWIHEKQTGKSKRTWFDRLRRFGRNAYE